MDACSRPDRPTVPCRQGLHTPPPPLALARVHHKRSCFRRASRNCKAITNKLAQPSALERTFLAYHRTSLAISVLSVVVAQLNVLQHSHSPDPVFGFYVLGKPLAAAMQVIAIVVSLMGMARWWGWQQSLLRGKAVSGGWQLSLVAILVFLLVMAMFALVLAVQVRRYLKSE